MSHTFSAGQAVRYKPGYGTYGYEHLIEADGRIPAVVIGLTPTRVRIEIGKTVGTRKNGNVRTVDAASLMVVK